MFHATAMGRVFRWLTEHRHRRRVDRRVRALARDEASGTLQAEASAPERQTAKIAPPSVSTYYGGPIDLGPQISWPCVMADHSVCSKEVCPCRCHAKVSA